jgi:uncharacterized protein (DUF433 family)
MNMTIQISPETYKLLQQRAKEMQSTPEQIAEVAIRLQLGNTIHIVQKQTPFGPQAYLRGTRVAVRHVAAFLKAGYSMDEITKIGLSHIPPAALYEAVAYYFDHQDEIEAELDANSQEAMMVQLRKQLSPKQYAQLTSQAA